MTTARSTVPGWNTDTKELARAISEFEAALPGFWWSVGQCSVGAHASCAVDGKGCQSGLLDGVKSGEPFDEGFHCDTTRGAPAEAIRDVMRQAVEYMTSRCERRTTASDLAGMLAEKNLPDDVRKSALLLVTWLSEQAEAERVLTNQT